MAFLVNVRHSHLHTVWGWKDMEADLHLPEMKRLRHVHVLNFFTHGGAVYVKWKQYMTSDTWSTPVIMVPPADVSRVALWRPPVRPKRFPNKGRMQSWLNRFEESLAHSHDAYTQHKPKLDILRQTIDGELPEYSGTADINAIISDIIRVGRGCVPTAAPPRAALPHDAIIQFFPGGDVPEMPVDALVEIPGLWQPPAPDDILGPGSMVICRQALTMRMGATSTIVPFSLGMAIPGNAADNPDYILVAWWVPTASPSASLRPGEKAKVIDLFGPWVQYDELMMGTAASVTVPPVNVSRADVLLMNVELDADSQIPFTVLDALRIEHAIDVSALSLSLTHRGNIYRAHVLQTPPV